MESRVALATTDTGVTKTTTMWYGILIGFLHEIMHAETVRTPNKLVISIRYAPRLIYIIMKPDMPGTGTRTGTVQLDITS